MIVRNMEGSRDTPEVRESSVVKDQRLELPDDSGHWKPKIEFPDDSGEWKPKIELPDDSGVWTSNLASNEVSENTEGAEANEKKELTPEEINEMQRAAIKEAFEKILRGEKLTDAEKGNLCEMMMDQYYISQGYTPLHNRVTSLDDKGHQGIDGVYERENVDGTKDYVIADAKFGTAQLNTTVDGTKQMSDEWIDKRLDDCVGKEKADEIRDAYEDNPDSVRHEVYHYDPQKNDAGISSSDITGVDSDGNKSSGKEIVEHFDEYGNIIVKDGDTDA